MALGRADRLSATPAAEEWGQLFEEARRQTVAGVCATGIERLPEWQRPPKDIALRWASYTLRVERQSRMQVECCMEAVERLNAMGIGCCVLKGMSAALRYPDPMRRQCGDIDLWLDAPAEDIIRLAKEYRRTAGARYHHVELPAVRGVPVEAHYRPSYICCPWHNVRVQRFFRREKERQFANRRLLPNGKPVCCPTDGFDAVYHLCHLYRHFFDEGIGLRQMLDYYYITKSVVASGCGLGEIVCSLGRFGLLRFASAVMYVLHVVFGLTEEEMLVPMDEGEGRFLLGEIMLAGNFGHYDCRVGNRDGESRAHIFVRKTLRSVRFVAHYPAEALCEPLFRLFHWVWRMVRGRC